MTIEEVHIDTKEISEHAGALGRLGGLKGGKEIAKKVAAKRWQKEDY